MKTVLKLTKWLLTIVVVIVAAILLGRKAMQWQTSSQRISIDPAIGVNEEFVEKIGDISQAFFARGLSKDMPVLLYVHGGPGTPMMGFSHIFQNEWEKHFIVVQWDQRNAGKTYFINDPEKVRPTMNSVRMHADLIETLEMLRKRYGKKKVALLGHSWGTMMADAVVRERPDLISVYVGTGVQPDSVRGAQEAFVLALKEANRVSNKEAIAALEKLKPYPAATDPKSSGAFDIVIEQLTVLGAGISRRYRGDITGTMLKLAAKSPEYGWRDISYFLIDDQKLTSQQLSREIHVFDARKSIAPFQVPVVFILGRYDYQTPSNLAAEYFNEISPPSKKLIWLEDSAHSPMVDEPEQFAKALIDNALPFAKGF
jgi:proline iminopeptidase